MVQKRDYKDLLSVILLICYMGLCIIIGVIYQSDDLINVTVIDDYQQGSMDELYFYRNDSMGFIISYEKMLDYELINTFTCQYNDCLIISDNFADFGYAYIADGDNYVIFNYNNGSSKAYQINGVEPDDIIFNKNDLLAITSNYKLYSVVNGKSIANIKTDIVLYDETYQDNDIIDLHNDYYDRIVDLKAGVIIDNFYQRTGEYSFYRNVGNNYTHYILENITIEQVDVFNSDVAHVYSSNNCENCLINFNDDGELINYYQRNSSGLVYLEKYNITTGKTIYTGSRKYKKILQIFSENDYLAVVDTDNVIKFVDNNEKTIAEFYEWNSDYSYCGSHNALFDENGIYGLMIIVDVANREDIDYYYFSYDLEKNKKTIYGDTNHEYVAFKPVLYLYPETKTNVSITFEHPELLTTTYPKYNTSWNVIAYPNGDLLDKNNKYYYALYWEEKSNVKVDFSEGFYVEKKDAITFLEEKLSYIGLNDKERNEFIMYWLPILENNEKSLVYFSLTDELQEDNEIIISPKPDSLLRLRVYVKKIDSKINIKEQKLEQFNRSGFSAIEWGGVVN